MPQRWLVKSDPDTYGYTELLAEGTTVWDGVGNNLALIHLRAMKKGDSVLVYESGRTKAILGTASVAKGPYPDPQLDDPKRVVVDLRKGRRLKHPVTLKTLKDDGGFADFELVRIPRLSVMPVSEAHWQSIQALAKA